jgi:hypothetical protein
VQTPPQETGTEATSDAAIANDPKSIKSQLTASIIKSIAPPMLLSRLQIPKIEENSIASDTSMTM